MVDNNQLLLGLIDFDNLIMSKRADCYYKYGTKSSGSDKEVCYALQNCINIEGVKFCS